MSESAAIALVRGLVKEFGKDGAHRALDAALGKLSPLELAAVEAHWPFWARPNQLAPAGDWSSWGFLGARGIGKTLAISKFINAEVEAGRAKLIAIAAQDEANSVKIQVLGPSGLIATSLPRCRPEWHASDLELVWPNGARAYVRTPEVPGKIRGLEYHLSWISEVQDWPPSHRDEAYRNFLLSTRLGYTRIVWDATPRRRHPILLKLLAQHGTDPLNHVVVRGATRENAANLGVTYMGRLEAEMGGTAKGREELLGEMLEDSDAALVKQSWIDRTRRVMPDLISRRVIGIDPAVTNRAGNDKTGIVDCALGLDGQVYVCGDYSGRHAPGAWAEIVLEKYIQNACDCVVVETNKGGDLVTQNLRAEAPKRGLTVVVIGKEERPHRATGVVYVRETHARGSKEDRAQPLATAYERGLVSHVIGAPLSDLEDTITTWEPTPGQRSPDALDALVHAATELLGLMSNRADPRTAMAGITELAAAVASGPGSHAIVSSLAELLGGSSGGGRI